jgi:DNA polymerase III subunit delta
MTSSRPAEGKAHPGPTPLVVLLVGSEQTLRDRALAQLRAAVLDGKPGDFDEDRYDLASGGLDPARIAGAARTLPVLAPRRLVLVRGLEEKRAAKFVEEVLPAYLENPSPTTTLVLVADKVDKRLRWVKRIAEIGELREYAAPSRPAEVKSWIEERIQAAGKRPGPGASAALFEAVGADLDRLASEIAKLALFAGARGEIRSEDVAELTADLRELALYELTDAVGNRRREEALRTLVRLLGQGEAPLAILAALANHFRMLLRAADCQPLAARQVQQKLGIHPFRAEKLVEQLRRFDPPRLLRCLDAIRRTDEALKGAIPLAPERSIEQLVLAVCA